MVLRNYRCVRPNCNGNLYPEDGVLRCLLCGRSFVIIDQRVRELHVKVEDLGPGKALDQAEVILYVEDTPTSDSQEPPRSL